MNRRFPFQRPGARQGMVLVEVIAALTIFTLVAFSLMRTLDAALDAAKSRTEVDMATRGLENQMALLHAGPLSLVDEDLPDDGTGMAYHLTVERADFQDQKKQNVSSMYRATITVKWESSGQQENRSVSELIYQQ